MQTVGAYEAKTHLAELLDQVARGERITITRHGAPVAVLVPVPRADRPDPGETIEELHRFRRGIRLGGLTLKELIEEGRR